MRQKRIRALDTDQSDLVDRACEIASEEWARTAADKELMAELRFEVTWSQAMRRGEPAAEFGDALCGPVGSATCALGSRGLMCRSLELR